MRLLARPIGLGLAARGDVDEVVTWARQARDQGLDSVWVHDSYFERDGVSFTTAIAQAIAADDDGDEAGFRVALGAANPFTRHPVVLAMTGSALDEILPGRFVLGIGTGLPLRLKQMGIPYEPDAARRRRVGRRSTRSAPCGPASGCRRRRAGLPPIQPMFPPTHRIPIVIAAYRKAFVELAGQKADGYLARPAESIPSLRGILERLHASAIEAGRDPGSTRDGRLPALARRQDAARGAEPGQARAVRHLHDVGAVATCRWRGPGSIRELRDRIAAAWRAEDFTTAGNLIPDELLDAFMLCGTREDVAAGAMAFHTGTGLHLPLLQPVLQEDRQIDELIAAAAIYASIPTGRPSASRGACRSASAGSRRSDRSGRRRCGRRTGDAQPGRRSAARPVASARGDGPGRCTRSCGRSPSPPRSSRSLAGAALAWVDELWNWPPFIAGPARRRSSCTPARTSSTRSTTSGRASTRSPARAPATRSSRAG